MTAGYTRRELAGTLTRKVRSDRDGIGLRMAGLCGGYLQPTVGLRREGGQGPATDQEEESPRSDIGPSIG